VAHKKGAGTSRNGRDSAAKRLGVKVFAARSCRQAHHRAPAGHCVSVRQWHGHRRDHTIFARVSGRVAFSKAPPALHHRRRRDTRPCPSGPSLTTCSPTAPRSCYVRSRR